jgi:hypothetical protein
MVAWGRRATSFSPDEVDGPRLDAKRFNTESHGGQVPNADGAEMVEAAEERLDRV